MTGTVHAEGIGVDLGGRSILDGVTIDVRPGEVLALVGPNGAGKSTLLNVLAGDLAPTRGEVRLNGKDFRHHRHLDRARLRSVLAQENAVSFGFTVREIVEMGRAPWARTPLVTEDDEAIEQAVAATDIGRLLNRRYPSLSGGEKARVSLARVLAQRTGIVFLDEPTAALDLGHQEEVMRVAARLAGEGTAVTVVLHDLTLAAAYADRVAIVSGGRLSALGAPDRILTAETIGQVYGLEVDVVQHRGRPVVLPVRG